MFTYNFRSYFDFIAYGNERYRISVCTNKNFIPLNFEIYEEDDSSNTIYNNRDHEFSMFAVFDNDNTRKLIIKVTTPEPKNKNNINDKYCIGVLVQSTIET